MSAAFFLKNDKKKKKLKSNSKYVNKHYSTNDNMCALSQQ